MRRNPSTVLVLAGQTSAELLATVGRSMNVSLVRPDEPSAAGSTASGQGIETAAAALRRAAGISSPYVLPRVLTSRIVRRHRGAVHAECAFGMLYQARMRIRHTGPGAVRGNESRHVKHNLHSATGAVRLMGARRPV